MKITVLILALLSLQISISSQRPSSQPQTSSRSTTSKPAASKTKPKTTPKTKSTPKPAAVPTPPKSDPETEKQDLEKIQALASPDERIAAFDAFLIKHPESRHAGTARTYLAASLASSGEARLNSGDTASAVDLFKRSVITAPDPLDPRLADDVFAKMPSAVFFSGERSASFELAASIEKRFAGNAARLLALAGFYLSVENGTEAKRLAEAAIGAEPSSSVAYQTLAMANRLNFDLEGAATAYTKALELDPTSQLTKRSLAEIKRATGKSDQAESLYREILSANEADTQARNGLILAMFDAGKKEEAEITLKQEIERNPTNLILFAGAAYWYAANNDGDRAVELASKAIAIEPRYIWSHIALARGLMLQGKPVDAERVLVSARKYGNFPTLEYEIAISRLKAGFFREAAEELEKSFTTGEDQVSTRLGGRIERADRSFDDILAPERQASILAPKGPADKADSESLRSLFLLTRLVKKDDADETALAQAAESFVAGDDPMRFHRQIFAASLLLDKRKAVAKALDLVASATGRSDGALSVANPSAAVMASELYETRVAASIRNEFLVVPDVPRQTLSAILRGRIEELTGYALLLQGKPDEASIRLRRAISVLPEKSAWWRTSKWRLGEALAAEGKDAEALEQFIQGYDTSKPDIVKYITVEGLYKKLNGGTDGLEARIGPNPLPPIVPSQISSEPKTEKAVAENSSPETVVKPEDDAARSRSEVVARPENSRETVKVAETPAQPKEEVKPSETPAVSSTVTEKLEPPRTDTETAKPKDEKPATDLPVKDESNNIEPERPPKPDQPPTERIIGNDPQQPKAEAAKPLFEPIVITIPQRTPPEKPAAANSGPPTETKTTGGDSEKPKDETPAGPPPTSDNDRPIARSQEPENTKTEQLVAEQKTAEPSAEIPSGSMRPRIVPLKEPLTAIKPCTIDVSQENVSLINSGGSVGILVGIDGSNDVKTVIGVSSDPQDVEVKFEPEIAGVAGRAFFVIRSLSTRTGSYKVEFQSPCGKKDITVNVR